MIAVERLIVSIAHEFVELCVLLVFDFAFCPRPDGFNSVDFLAFDFDREGNEGRILLDDPLDGEFLAVIVRILLQLHDNFRAAMQAVAGADGVAAVAVGKPFVALAAVPGAALPL